MKFEIAKTQGWNLLNIDDLETLKIFNDKNRNSDVEILGELLPEPFIGNPEKAKVLLLALNPGFKGGANGEYKWHKNESFGKLIFDNIELKETKYPYYYLNTDKSFDKSPGHEWCKRVFRELIEAVTAEELSKKISCIQFHGYHSKKYKYLGNRLPSQEQTFGLIRSSIKRKIPIVIMRSKKIWFNAISELEDYSDLIILKNPRNPTLSDGNMMEGDFNKLVKALK